ncbi:MULTISPECIES: DRTGG domain-containing protein [Bacillus]|uniref:DRTGG domain-containing protein n=1 Tax=Bacillus TaxID=1386 RepID=UPI0005903F48|nr:DRTGG domain-containing protein [Bacillus smithii]AKP48104.1 Cytosolic protein containing multiple CBS domains [Bacillus smithii]MED0658896.1 DRTGG domain-containing protein [Bacillus smithii]MED1418547.1 DRTGG domain-containing protein [Bacillus smithii]MED1455884.1 DRTGG domain-containing protein [Bacillus smithii]MED4884753.1 DRTGG domain-containing protein [Bacillus smithii]
MATKHEQILEYIEGLPIGEKISVRQIAKALNVSEGTAYRAIKDAETKGFVSAIERVGTIRIEKKKKENIEKLTYAEVVNIIDGQVLGGRAGLYKTLNKFVIGAMKLDAMMRYTGAGNLLIVGNRTQAHELALRAGAGVLITGGFDTEDHVKKLADELELPIISTSYDTFTVATMINRAIYDQLIKKEIILVGDTLTPVEKTAYLTLSDTVGDYHEKNKKTGHGRFPVVDQQLKVVGIVTTKDIMGYESDVSIEKVMTKKPLTVSQRTSVASAAHMMIWEGIEVLPVVDDQNKLQGIISRQDVLKALQMNSRQPQVGETIDDLITKQFDISTSNQEQSNVYKFEVTPQMTNQLGTISYGVFTTLVTEAANRALKAQKKGDHVVENMTIYYFKPVQLESMIEIHPKVLEAGRKFGKIDIEVFNENKLVGKALLMVQMIDR